MNIADRIADAQASNSALYRAPGRVNIIGEHTDYNDGFVLPTNTALYTWLTARPRPDRTVQVRSLNFADSQSFCLDDIRRSDNPGWLDYLKGVAALLIDAGIPLRGADISIDGEVPIGKGLSSSASLELAAAVALLDIAAAELRRAQLARLCQQAEQRYIGVDCGIMDQYSVACCGSSEAMLLDCRSLQTTRVTLPAHFALLLVDSGVKHRHSDSGYNDRAEECRQAVALIGAADADVNSLRDVSMTMLTKHEDRLGKRLHRRSRHVVSENGRVAEAVAAIKEGDMGRLGALINASHASLRDDFAVSCDEIETLIEITNACEGVVGSRMVGGGFGGCVLALTQANRLEKTISEIDSCYVEVNGKKPWMHTVSPATAAGKVGVQ